MIFRVLLGFACLAVICAQIPSGFLPIPPVPIKIVTKKPPPTPKPTIKQTPPSTSTTVPSTSTALPPSHTVTVKTQATPKPTSNSGNCKFNFNLPNGGCKGSTSALQKSLDLIKQELDKTKAQHVAQNAAVQGMVGRLQTQQSRYVAKIADLQNEVKNLVAAFNALSSRPLSTPQPSFTPTSGPAPGPNVMKLIQDVKDDLNKAVKDVQDKLLNVTSQAQNTALQESQLQASIQSRVATQANEVGRISQQVKQLETQLTQLLAVPTASPSSAPSSAALAQLQSQIRKLEKDLTAFDTKQQKDITQLQANAFHLNQLLASHNTDISDLKISSQTDTAKISKNENDITVVHDALANVRKSYQSQMTAIESDVNALKVNVSRVDASVVQVGNTALNTFTRGVQDRQKLNGLELQVKTLNGTVSTLQSSVNGQAAELLKQKLDLVRFKRTVSVGDLQRMNQVISRLQAGTTPNKADLAALKKTVTDIQNALKAVSPGTTG